MEAIPDDYSLPPTVHQQSATTIGVTLFLQSIQGWYIIVIMEAAAAAILEDTSFWYTTRITG